jgi:hypothetical protein
VRRYEEASLQCEAAERRGDAAGVAYWAARRDEFNTQRNWVVAALVEQYKQEYRQLKEVVQSQETAAVEQLALMLQQHSEGLYCCIAQRLKGRVRDLLRKPIWKQSDWYRDAANNHDEFFEQATHGFLLFILAKLPAIRVLDPERAPIEYLLTIAARAARREMLPRPPKEVKDRLPMEALPLDDVKDIPDPASEQQQKQIEDRLFESDFKQAVITFANELSIDNRNLFYGRLVEEKSYEEITRSIERLTGIRRTVESLRHSFFTLKQKLIAYLRDQGLLGDQER